MPLAVVVMIVGLNALHSAGTAQSRTEQRESALGAAQTGMERMTREIRQADWVFFRSSSEVDLAARVRAARDTPAQMRHVRYSCAAGECVRLEGPPVAFPPPAGAALTLTHRVVPGLRNADVFEPRRIDPASGEDAVDFHTPNALRVRLEVHLRDFTHPVELRDATSLRNATRFAP